MGALTLDARWQCQRRSAGERAVSPPAAAARFYRASLPGQEAGSGGVRWKPVRRKCLWLGEDQAGAGTGGRAHRSLYPARSWPCRAAAMPSQERWVLLRAEQADGIGVGSPSLYLGLEAGKVKTLEGRGQRRGDHPGRSMPSMRPAQAAAPVLEEGGHRGQDPLDGVQVKMGTSPPCAAPSSSTGSAPVAAAISCLTARNRPVPRSALSP